jgi:hypothetical protein
MHANAGHRQDHLSASFALVHSGVALGLITPGEAYLLSKSSYSDIGKVPSVDCFFRIYTACKFRALLWCILLSLNIQCTKVYYASDVTLPSSVQAVLCQDEENL